MTVDVHFAVIGHGIVALEPQLNGVHVELALFEVVNLLHARRVLCGVGIPEGNGYRLPGFHVELHFLPAFVGDLILVGIGGGDRRGRAGRLAGRVVSLYVVDVQVMKGFVFRCNKRNFAIDGIAEVIVVPGFVEGNRAARLIGVEDIIGIPNNDGTALIVSSGIRQCRANIKNLIARESIRAACRATRKGQRQPHVIANRLKVSRHIGHRCVLNFSQGARNSIGPVVLGFDKFAERLIRHAALYIGKIIGIRLALFERDVARKHTVRIMIDHGRVEVDATRVLDGVGHATGHDGIVCRRGGVVAGSVLFGGCRIVHRCRRCVLLSLLRFCRGLRHRSRVSHRRSRGHRYRRRSRRILRNRRRHRSRGDLARRSGGIGIFGRQRHARQQQLTDHKRTRAGTSDFGTYTTPGTMNQRAGALALSLLIKAASVHNGLLGRRGIPPQRCLSPLRWSCTTKMCKMTPHA